MASDSNERFIHCGAPNVADGETFREGIFRIDYVLGKAGDPRPAAESWYNRAKGTDVCFTHEATGENRSQDPFVGKRLIESELALRVENGHSRAGASATW